MRYPFPIRLLLALAVSLGLAALLVIVLYLTELGFEVWTYLKQTPPWFATVYALGLGSIAAGGAWIIWRLLSPRAKTAAPQQMPALPRSSEEVQQRIDRAELAGVDVAAARRELEELRSRREAGEVVLVLFGQVSAGKSSLVRALLPDAKPAVDVRAGTTRQITRYTWTSPAEDRLVLTDLPGLNEPDGSLDSLAREEAQRAHVVIYVVDGDMTRNQHREFQALRDMQKPMILALNKTDRYTNAELVQLKSRLTERAGMTDEVDIVAVSTGGSQEVVRMGPDGREQRVVREMPPQIDELIQAVQRRIDEDPANLERLRDVSVFVLATGKLDEALTTHRRTRSDQLIKEYTRKAVLGALAAVAPGTDVLIQGYLGVQLVQKLCEVYDVPARKIEIDRLLDLISRRVVKALPLVLALVGNGLKAFPGIGTLTGGILHAIAYGIIFDSLGHAVAETLASRRTLASGAALRTFEDNLSEDLDARARRLAKLALEQLGTAGPRDKP